MYESGKYDHKRLLAPARDRSSSRVLLLAQSIFGRAKADGIMVIPQRDARPSEILHIEEIILHVVHRE